jgi:tRNA1Val (adenine37-N6)-methyltransferase
MGRSGNRLVRFSAFDVRDDQCAMKVGSDGLILGAWAGCAQPLKVLDIGTGSGLIALMAAQRFPSAEVTAVELEPRAAQQARANFDASPFAARLALVEADFIGWSKGTSGTWDWVVCNPPFFRNKPKSPDPARNLARHDDALPLEELIQSVTHLSHEMTRLSLVWPVDRSRELEAEAASKGWGVVRVLDIHATPTHPCERQVIEFSQGASMAPQRERLDIEMATFKPGNTPDRTPAFKKLLAPFMDRYASEA